MLQGGKGTCLLDLRSKDIFFSFKITKNTQEASRTWKWRLGLLWVKREAMEDAVEKTLAITLVK